MRCSYHLSLRSEKRYERPIAHSERSEGYYDLLKVGKRRSERNYGYLNVLPERAARYFEHPLAPPKGLRKVL
jgi:hypothetical protein